MNGYTLTKVRQRLARLPADLLAHCERVRLVSLDLAYRWGAPPEKAEFVAMTHDIARAFSRQELIKQAREYDLVRNEIELRLPVLLHGSLGAEILRHEWGIDDMEILGAIACHTIGCPEMNTLDKILFLADKIEPGKSYPRLMKVKELATTDLDGAVLELLDQLIEFHVDMKELIHPAGLAARNSLLIKLGKSRE